MFRPTIATLAVLAIAVPAFAQDPAPAAAPDVRAKLAAIDTDRDGKWSKAEWIAGGRRDRGFDRLDADKDGQLTRDEIKAGVERRRAARAQ